MTLTTSTSIPRSMHLQQQVTNTWATLLMPRINLCSAIGKMHKLEGVELQVGDVIYSSTKSLPKAQADMEQYQVRRHPGSSLQ
jgi:hypothetical protein